MLYFVIWENSSKFCYLNYFLDESGAEGSEGENRVVQGLMALVLALCLLYGEGIDNDK